MTEFVIAGLLTEVGTDLGVSVSVAGQLVGVYALAVAPGALILTPLLMRRSPNWALVALLGFFIVGNVLSAWAPGYGVMYAGRIVAALAHGGYFEIGAVLAGLLVPERRRASAVATLFAGLTIANVLGVPAGTFIGQRIGWHAVFWNLAATSAMGQPSSMTSWATLRRCFGVSAALVWTTGDLSCGWCGLRHFPFHPRGLLYVIGSQRFDQPVRSVQLDQWLTHYDPTVLAAELTDEQVATFLRVIEHTIAFADTLKAALT